MSHRLTFILGIVLITILSCKEEEDNSNHSPSINFVNVAPTSVYEFTDSIVFTISYEDQDGDIGFPYADTMSLWLKDARLEEADGFFIAPLAPLDATVHIQGEFDIILPNTFRLGTGPQEITSFTI